MKRPIIIGRLVPFEKVKCKEKELIKLPHLDIKDLKGYSSEGHFTNIIKSKK